MSIKVATLVKRSSLPSSLKHTARELADYAADDGSRIWPSVATVASATGKSVRQTRYDFRRLEALGVLIVERRSAGGLQSATSQYRLNIHALTPAMGCRGRDIDQRAGDIAPELLTPAICDADPGNLRHEPRQPVAADPSVDPSVDPSRAEHAREARGFPLPPDERRRLATAPAVDGNEGVLRARCLRLIQVGRYMNLHGRAIDVVDESDLADGLKTVAIRDGIALDALSPSALRDIAAWVWRMSRPLQCAQAVPHA